MIEETKAVGVELSNTSGNPLHLVYWLGDGNLVHRISEDGYSWSVAETIDESGSAAHPRMVSRANGVVYLVWERLINGKVVPVWNCYAGGKWHEDQNSGATGKRGLSYSPLTI